MKKRWIAGITAAVCIAAAALSGASVKTEEVSAVPSGDSGYAFIGWNTAADGSGRWYQPDEKIKSGTLKSDLDLYAQWMKTEYTYTGAVQAFTAPVDGTYRLECWGASGGDSYNSSKNINYYGGRGGYAAGTIALKKGDTLYISVGGAGGNTVRDVKYGGWNGGGHAYSYELVNNLGTDTLNQVLYFGSGGGATSIQKSLAGDGQLKNYESVKDTDVYLVAGGGGGSYGGQVGPSFPDYYGQGNGGYGGGETGGDSEYKDLGYAAASGASQTSGGTVIKQNCDLAVMWSKDPEGNHLTGTFGEAAVPRLYWADGNSYDGTTGGGGGWYGGASFSFASASGGSGHVGTMISDGENIAGNQSFDAPDGKKETGHSGSGYARITLMTLPK